MVLIFKMRNKWIYNSYLAQNPVSFDLDFRFANEDEPDIFSAKEEVFFKNEAFLSKIVLIFKMRNKWIYNSYLAQNPVSFDLDFQFGRQRQTGYFF